MKPILLRTRTSTDPSAEQLSRFHENVYELAKRGKEFPIEILVEAVCRAYYDHEREMTSRADGGVAPAQISALVLVYHQQYHGIFVEHRDVTMRVVSSMKNNLVASLWRILLELDFGLDEARVPAHNVLQRKLRLQECLKVFNESLDRLVKLEVTPHVHKLATFQKLYKDFENLAQHVMSGARLSTSFPEADKLSLPKVFHDPVDLILQVNGRNSVDVLTAPKELSKMTTTIDSLRLPIEQAVVQLLLCDLWLLEEWFHE